MNTTEIPKLACSFVLPIIDARLGSEVTADDLAKYDTQILWVR
jgi:hypothetical protein